MHAGSSGSENASRRADGGSGRPFFGRQNVKRRSDMKTVHRTLVRMAFAAGALAVAFAAHAQDYPTKPITIVVPFPPGASTDTAARALLPKMTEVLGQPVVVDNRGGSGGNVGTGFV